MASLFSKSVIRRKRLLIGTIVITLFFSNQFIYNEFVSAWENSVPNQLVTDETYEVAIVLGGVAGFDESKNLFKFNSNAERILDVLPLYFDGKVKKILLAGGSGSLTDKEREADILKSYLLSIGVKKQDLLIERESRNTYENARNSINLLKEKGISNKILLSTSALHMPRAYACFSKLGCTPTPFPVDHYGSPQNLFRADKLLMPKPEIISHWYLLIHEWIGMLTYQLMGYC